MAAVNLKTMLNSLLKFSHGALPLALLAISAPASWGSIIAGPTLDQSISGHTNSGIAFTALTDATLTSFDYSYQGLQDTVVLTDGLGNVLDTIAIPASTGNSIYTANILWTLTANGSYQLLATANSPSNGRYGQSLFPVSDSEISVVSGIFSGVSNNPYWADFNNITTSTASGQPTPEPGSIFLLTGGCIFLISRRGQIARRVLTARQTRFGGRP